MLFKSTRHTHGAETSVSDIREPALRDRAIGDILKESKGWNDDQVNKALAYQRNHGVRFGDAVVALGLARPDEVMWALSQQFHYHYRYQAPGSVRLRQELVMANEPFSDDVEAFRDLRSHLVMSAMAATGDKRGVLGVLSPDRSDGKTFIAANLAVAFSQLPGRTLLVDADMRSPRSHMVFGLRAGTGLSGILSGRSEANVISPVPELPNLFLLPVGPVPPNPLELLQRPAFALLIDELALKFDYVLVDTPAAVHGADARVIAALCGVVLVVGRRDHTRARSLQALMHQLRHGSTPVSGVVMNEF